MYKNIVNGSYSKYDGDVGLHSYYLRYSFIDNGTMSYTRSSDYFEVDYNGKTIIFNRSSCEMVKEQDKFVMKEDSSATCIKDTPSDDLINKVVEEYDKINN
jgi:hypothetical protein